MDSNLLQLQGIALRYKAAKLQFHVTSNMAVKKLEAFIFSSEVVLFLLDK